jgi:hypothetical protein
MAIGVPSFMPEATAAASTVGLLTVSSTTIQGSAILEIVVNDPDNNNVSDDITAVDVDFGENTYTMTQATNGKWYLYIADASQVVIAEANGSAASGMEYGILCSSGLGTESSTTTLIVPSDTSVYAEAIKTSHGIGAATILHSGACYDINDAVETTDDASNTVAREKMSDAVLTGSPTLSDPNGDQTNLGQRVHKLNASGYGSWPYIVAVEFTDDNLVTYGDDTISVAFGNTDDETSISLTNQSPGANAEIHLSITDPALNIDPTGADIWQFDLSDKNDGSAASTVEFATNGTTHTALTAVDMTEAGFLTNGQLQVDSETVIRDGNGTSAPNSNSCCTTDTMLMTESGANTDVFESWDVNGNSQITTVTQAAVDSVAIFKYGGDSVDMIITYADAEITMDAGGEWAPATSVTITVDDADANKNPTSTETLTIEDETDVLPTIKVGSPLTLATGSNTDLQAGDKYYCNTKQTAADKADSDCTNGVVFGTAEGGAVYGLNVFNTTDNSERLRIKFNGTTSGSPESAAVGTTYWLNVTTGHTKGAIVALPGTPVLSYDVTALADTLSSTDINVYLIPSNNNQTNNTLGNMQVVSDGNVKAGVVDLSDDTQFVVDKNVSASKAKWGDPNHASTNLVLIAFEFTVASSTEVATNLDFAIAADICNFDQDNGSLVHNCIYRLEAKETGDNTGVFEGSVEYVTLNNSTAQYGQAGNANAVEDLLGYVAGDSLSVVLMDAVSGSDSVRVVYNDTESNQTTGGTKIGAQLETVTHTGTVDLDLDKYGAGDYATITIVDPDLNQDSALRDTYTNSSTTFQVTYTGDSGTSGGQLNTADQTILETGPGTGVFVGTFLVPSKMGFDMELVYYESKDAGSNTVEYYDVATVAANSGAIALDRSVYPVPWTAGELRTGDSGQTLQTEAGAVTAWITVTDADEVNDTLTTGSTTAAGTILVKLGTTTCFTAGSIASASAGAAAAELGPLSETSIGSQAYEISASLTDGIDCGATDVTIESGTIMQVHYVDSADDAGTSSTFFDSATFDLRTGTLTTDKDVYVMGSDMVITLTDPDLNLDSSTTESYAMSLIQWDSAANSDQLLATSTATNTSTIFTSNPSSITETGDDTGVFQTVTTLPTDTIGAGNTPEYGEAVTLTYRDVGLNGESLVEGDTQDVEAHFNISNFGAIVELDKALYTWTSTVYITITAPDHNNNSSAEEVIGTATLPIQVSTRAGKMCNTSTTSTFYTASETGPDTGVFTSDVDLNGYSAASPHNSVTPAFACDKDANTSGTAKTAGQTDGISVSFEYTDGVVVVASASIAFNIAEAGFDVSSASSGGSALISVTDPDENTNGDVIEDFTLDVYSDSDNGGLTLTLAETDEDTGVFEATVFFTADGATSGSSLRVSEGDTVTAEYTDKTLPEPYTDSDTLTVASTLTIGTAFPPLERAPAANARVVDAFGASVAEVSVDQQVQIAADVSNGQSKDQAFAYLVQVQDSDGVTVSLAWITGSLTAGQSMSPALSWTPSDSGSYTATVFVWESVDNPTALSPTVSVDIDVV